MEIGGYIPPANENNGTQDHPYTHKIITSNNEQYVRKHFNMACEQVALLNQTVNRLVLRNRSSEITGSLKSLRYSYRLQLIVLEGTRSMFYNYAVLCSTRLIELKQIDDVRRETERMAV